MKKHPNREKAITNGENKYHGSPCKNCFATLKYVQNGSCIKCAKDRKNSAEYVALAKTTSAKYNKLPHVVRKKRAADLAHRKTDKYKKYVDSRRTHVREYSRRYHGLPEATRSAPSLCECCGKMPIGYVLALDHDHITEEFRGWLCRKCNVGIGVLGDTLESVRMAVNYLERCRAD